MQHIYKDPSFSIAERVKDLMNAMTVEEKIGQMMQISYSCISKEEAEEWVTGRFAGSYLHVLGDDARHLQELASKTRLGIPLVFGIDAVHGHALHNGATIFPSQLSMACSWNADLIEEAGKVTAKEVIADGLHWTFSPLLCIGRDIRWGRINETFGEDPYLVGKLASALIKGYQGDDLADPNSILACAKHYIAYGESTGGRDSYDTQVSIRKVKEVFLPPFKEAVEAGCATFMAGYQSVDGTPMSANKRLLRRVLKEELGFEGFVVTDWNNAGSLMSIQKVAADIEEAAKKAIEAGNDMIMNTNAFYDAAVALVKEGIVAEELIDEAVQRILSIKFALGLFDGKGQISASPSSDIFACPEHLEINLKLTRETMVLLENKNDTLPLGGDIKKIAVIGPNADDIKSQFGDWTFFSHPDPDPNAVSTLPVHTMLVGIQELAKERGIEVLYNKGCRIMDAQEHDIDRAMECAAEADVIIAVIGDCLEQNGEVKDRADLSLSGAQQKLLENLKLCGKPLVVILVNGKPLCIPWVAENADAVLETFNSGLLGGKAAAEVIFGEVNPSGKLPISFPQHSGQLPVYYNQLPGWHIDKYMDMPVEPLYSFGYGLSYTSFEYSNLKLSQDKCSKEDIVIVSVEVSNVGAMAGKETVQLYVNDLVSSVITPFKELKGFAKVELEAGETKTVTIPLKASQLTIVDEDENYVVEPGEFQIMVGSDSRDASLLKTVLKVE